MGYKHQCKRASAKT